MESTILKLTQRFQTAITTVLGPDININATIVPASRSELGDYQANFAMALAKKLGQNPRKIAESIVQAVDTTDLIASLEIAGPGFINIRLKDSYCIHVIQKNLAYPSLFAKAQHPLRVVVDYGGANVAKEMHVGHLRSTIIGDAITRLLEALGHIVIRQNHLGDFGTQFGMLIQYILEEHIDLSSIQEMSDLNSLYRASKQHFDADPSFADRARSRVVKLQADEPETRTIWQYLVDKSVAYFQKTYDRLGVLLKPSDNCGESFYMHRLALVIQELLQKGFAERSEGAVVIFLDGYLNPDQKPLPFLIEKSDGGYLYATTDLAALQYRIQDLQADRLIYVTDSRQKQHFMMLFDAARKAGWVKTSTRLDHIAFGAVLGEDGKPFKTRSGESVKLNDLIDEALSRALAVIQKRDQALPPSERANIAQQVGIGALKYADLSSDRERDYIFSWDRMLAFEGNTAPYLQNAYVRICSIFRKAGINPDSLTSLVINWTEPKEHELAIKILEFPDVIHSILEDCFLHRLCRYLYDLSGLFHSFYEALSILNAEKPIQRDSRLVLAAMTAKVLKAGLNILGVEVLERM